jgi:hypothetical protein
MPHSTPETYPEPLQAARKRGHEIFHFDVRYLQWFTVFIVILVIVTAFCAFELIGGFRVPEAPATGAQADENPKAGFPTLQAAPAGDLRSYRAGKAGELDGYGWVDQANGVVRIPIERAMELIVEQPQSAPAPAPAARKPERRK